MISTLILVAALADITINQPKSYTPGKYSKITVTGIQNLPKAIVRCYPDDAEIVLAKDWSDNPFIWINPQNHNYDLVIIDLEGKQFAEAKIMLTNPDPGPGPGPKPPTPDPKGKYQVLIITEKANLPSLSQEQRDIVSGLTVRDELKTRGHTFLGSFDKDIRDKTGQVPFPAFFHDLSQVPCIKLAPVSGGDIITLPLPKSKKELFDALP